MISPDPDVSEGLESTAADMPEPVPSAIEPGGNAKDPNRDRRRPWWDGQLTTAASIATIIGTIIALVAYFSTNDVESGATGENAADPTKNSSAEDIGDRETRSTSTIRSEADNSELLIAPSEPLKITDLRIAWTEDGGEPSVAELNSPIPAGAIWHLKYEANFPHHVALYQGEINQAKTGLNFRRLYPTNETSKAVDLTRPLPAGRSLRIPPRILGAANVYEFEVEESDYDSMYVLIGSRETIPVDIDVASVLPDDAQNGSRTGVVVRPNKPKLTVSTFSLGVATNESHGKDRKFRP